MNKNDFKNAIKQYSFKPFIIKISGEQKFEIYNSDSIAISPVGDICIIFSADGHYHTIDISKITSVEII